MKYFLIVSYDGKNYYGWSPQPGVPTVSKTIKDIAQEILGNQIKLYASGRTDRYVHALRLPVTIEGNDSLSADMLMEVMNEKLPKDIKVLECKKIENKFEVRYGTKCKTYKYLTNLDGDGDVNYYNNHTYPFDLERMIEISKEFIGKKNFASFTAKRDYVNYVREIFEINIFLESNILIIEITGDGFLRFMVRNIVGVLLAHNRLALTTLDVIDLLENPKKGKAHYKAVGAGLYLKNVLY